MGKNNWLKAILKIKLILISFFIYAPANANTESSSADQVIINVVMAGLNGYIGYTMLKTCPEVTVNCAMGAMAVAQVGLNIKGAFESGGTNRGVRDDYGVGNPNIEVPYENGTGSGSASSGSKAGSLGVNHLANVPPVGRMNQDWLDAQNQAVKNTLADLKNKGYSVNVEAGTITTPKGSFPTSSLSSPEKIAESGLGSLKEAQDAFKKMKEAEKTALALAKVNPSDFSGGGIQSKGARVVANEPQFADFSKLLKQNAGKKEAPTVAGLSKTIAGGTESIGVAGDNIFQMIHRCYQSKKSNGDFLPK